MNDNSADTDDYWPNGTEVLHTYEMAQKVGLTKMPSIPAPDVIVSRKLNKQAIFLGCYDKSKVTIVFLPNAKYTFDSNVPTATLEYSPQDLDGMIKNGNNIATQGGDKDWPVCLACAMTHKTSRWIPKQCQDCLRKYCIAGEGSIHT